MSDDLLKRIEDLERRHTELHVEVMALRRRVGGEPDAEKPKHLPAAFIAEPIKAEPVVVAVAQPVIVPSPLPPVLPPPLPVAPLRAAESDYALAEAAAIRERIAATPAAPPKPDAAQEFLRGIQMLPPKNAGSMEAQLGIWWLSRIGALIFIIGIVFFAIYVSNRIPPPVRLAEIMLAACGVAGLGLWLEKKSAQLGAVLFGTGLAMLFMAAFGAYAAPPIKVFDSALAGAICQFAAALLIVAAAHWRNSQTIASMGVLCGFVACLFSAGTGHYSLALTSALTLGAGGAGLVWWRGWAAPYWCAVPMSYVVFLVVAMQWRMHGEERSALGAWGFPLAAMMLYIAADWRTLKRGPFPWPMARRLVMFCNTSCAILLGLMATALFQDDWFEKFYFAFGIALLACAGIYHATDKNDRYWSLFFIKGSALFTMGLVSYFDGRTRWIALAMQALVMFLTAPKTRMPKLTAACGYAAWLLSFGFYIGDMDSLRNHSEGIERSFLSLEGLWAALYVVFSTWLLGIQGRRAQGGKGGGQQVAVYFCAFMCGIAALFAIATFAPGDNGPAWLAGLAAFMGATGLHSRHRAAAAAAAIPYAAAVFAFRIQYMPGGGWTADDGAEAPGYLGLNTLVVGGLTAGGAVASQWGRERIEGLRQSRGMAGFVLLLTAAAMFVGQTALYQVAGPSLYLTLAAAAAIAVSFAIGSSGRAAPISLAALPLLYALIDLTTGAGDYPWRMMIGRLAEDRSPLLLGGAFLALMAAERMSRNAGPLNRPPEAKSFRVLEFIHTGLATVLAIGAVYACFGAGDQAPFVLLLALTFAAAVPAMLAIAPPPLARVLPMYWSAVAFIVCTHLHFYRNLLDFSRGSDMRFMGASILCAVGTLGLAMQTRRLRPDFTKDGRMLVVGAGGAAALALAFALFEADTSALGKYASVMWGLSAMTVLVGGLIAPGKILRLEGLAALALCLGRIFLVDAHSTLYRIFAFLGIGCVLLAAAYLYTRFRERLARLSES